MSDFSLVLVLQIKTSKNHQWHGQGKHKIWENHSFWRNISREGAFFPFCGSGYRQSSGASVHIVRLSKREIVGSLSSVYFCGGDCVEDVTSHLMPHLSLHPTLRTCSSDTILRGISELSCANTRSFFAMVQSYTIIFNNVPLHDDIWLTVFMWAIHG